MTGLEHSPLGALMKPRQKFEVWSVSELNQRAKSLLERQFVRVSVQGEVSNLKISSGHAYFTLKDSRSQLPAVVFRRERLAARFELRNGMELVITGKLTLYVPYGRYQIIGEEISPKGLGALQLAFEQLKEKLQTEGLFAPERKRSLPLLPMKVAVITSPTGAVIRDIAQVAGRRYPNFQILLFPSRVQGKGCEDDLSEALARVSALHKDLNLSEVIVARGGGSLEDLWGFNSEKLARQIARCPIPVVSGVGHETDFTICDFVADVRAPTPSAASEIVFPQKHELHGQLEIRRVSFRRNLSLALERKRRVLEKIRLAMGDGREMIRDGILGLEIRRNQLEQGMRQRIKDERLGFQGLSQQIESRHPRRRVLGLRERVRAAEHRMRLALGTKLKRLEAEVLTLEQNIRSQGQGVFGRKSERLGRVVGKLDALSPLGVLARGYAIAQRLDSTVIKDAASLEENDELLLRFHRGETRVRVV